MFYISIFVIKTGTELPVSQPSSPYKDIYSIINYSHENIDYSISLNEINDIIEIPNKCDSDAVLIAEDNLLFRSNILDTIFNISELFDDYGILCGPTSIKVSSSKNEINKNIFSLYEYNLNFGNTKISDITSEPYNYPSINGCIISGQAYNNIVYKITKSNRHMSIENKYFINMMSKKYKIYYSDHINKIKNIDTKIYNINKLLYDYYDNGYQDGRLLFMCDSDNKKKELWHKFIESPDAMDNSIPRWILEKSYNDAADYIEDLIILKCRYQIGFYEGMTNKSII